MQGPGRPLGSEAVHSRGTEAPPVTATRGYTSLCVTCPCAHAPDHPALLPAVAHELVCLACATAGVQLPMDAWAPLCIQIDRAPFQVTRGRARGVYTALCTDPPHTPACLPGAQVAELTPLPKVHFLFATCQFSQVSVTRQGRLVGVILKGDLTDPHRLAIASQEAVTASPHRSPARRAAQAGLRPSTSVGEPSPQRSMGGSAPVVGEPAVA